jgi:hypothetical protein
MRNLTLTAEGHLIDAARQRALAEHSSLNEQFRRWLAEYARADGRAQRHEAVMARLRGQIKLGRMPSRDERNER